MEIQNYYNQKKIKKKVRKLYAGTSRGSHKTLRVTEKGTQNPQ